MRKYKLVILSICACLLCGCGQGKKDAQAGAESSAALDFENVWVMSECGYPMLRWQLEMNSN